MTGQHASGKSRRAPKVGYLVAVIVNSAMLFFVNIRPGWRELPFLTEDFVSLVWLINLSMLSSAVVNMVYLRYDPAWFKSLCQVGISAIALTVAIRVLQVFPFDFSQYSFNWAALARLLLALAVFGSVVGIVAELARLTKSVIGAGDRSRSVPRL